MKKLFTSLLLLVLAVATVHAAEETITFSEKGYSDAQDFNGKTITGTNFSIAFSRGSNSVTPKYYTDGAAMRVYGGNTFTVSSNYTITKIVITFGSSDGSNAITASVGTYSNGTWTGSASSVVFSIGGTKGNRRLSAIAVTTSGGSSGATVAEPTLTDAFTFWPVMNDAAEAKVTITPAEGNTVRYTTNGATPTRTSGTEITTATTITITGTTTVKAISYVGTTPSNVVTKTYTLGETVTGIGAFKNVTVGNTVRLFIPDSYNARTLYVNGNEAFVRDNTGAICIYGVNTNPALKYNQHIAGWIIGKYTTVNGLPELVVSGDYTNSHYLVIADPVTEADAAPVEIDATAYDSNHADWVTIKDIAVTATGATATGSADNVTLKIYNKYNIGTTDYYQAPYKGAIVDVTGIAYPSGSTRQVLPIYQNENRPLTYVVDAEKGFTRPSASIASARVRLSRSLSAGRWNLLTVPFDITDFAGSVLRYTGVTQGEVATYTMAGKTYSVTGGVMHFENYSGTLEAGTPYLVKPSAAVQEQTFSNVTLSSNAAGSVTYTLTAQSAPALAADASPKAWEGDYEFVGAYEPATLDKDEKTVMLVDDSNISWTSLLDDTEIQGTEAYIRIPDGAGVRLDLAGSTATGINTLLPDEPQQPLEPIIYNLMGVRLTRPLSELPPGIYIVNGKKIVK